MLKKIKLLLVLIALFYVEAVLLTRFTWNGTVVPLVFTAGLVVAVVSDEWDTILAALAAGFFADLYSTHLFGLNMLLNLYIFLGLFWLKSHLRQEKNWLMALVIGAATFLRYGLHLVINQFTGLPQDFAPVPRLAVMALILAIPLLTMTRHLVDQRFKKTRRT